MSEHDGHSPAAEQIASTLDAATDALERESRLAAREAALVAREAELDARSLAAATPVVGAPIAAGETGASDAIGDTLEELQETTERLADAAETIVAASGAAVEGATEPIEEPVVDTTNAAAEPVQDTAGEAEAIVESIPKRAHGLFHRPFQHG